jgi:DnaK suppressor protein
MNIEQAKQKLEARQEELSRSMRRLGEDARESQIEGVEDPIDHVESTENKALNFRVNTIESDELKQVQSALQRIENGTYGKCVDCGRPISDARLEAKPWALYCVEDQEKHDKEEGSYDDLASPRIAAE